MRLEKVELKNFRCFKAETVQFSPYTAIVGPNNSGKSTVFKAIDLFFRTSQKTSPLLQTDFGDASKELHIALTFGDLSKQAQDEFSHYYRHGKLEFFIKARIGADGRIVASVHGRRSGIAAFGTFFEGANAGAKKATYVELQKAFADLPEVPAKSAVGNFEAALVSYEAQHPEQQTMIESEDLAFGASGVAARLRNFVDWVYIPAVKDAADEEEEAKNNAFGILVNRIIRAKVKIDEKVAAIRATAHDQISALVGDYQDEVKKLETVLDTEFRRLTSTDAHVHLDWAKLSEGNITLNMPLARSILDDGTYRGDVTKFGHGLQRNYLMMLVHLNAKLAIEDQPSIILACEEPELYQHPPQARYLHDALMKMAETDQVMVTTHSPYFISTRNFEDVRVIRKTPKDLSRVAFWTVEQHRQAVAAVLGEKPIGEKAALASLEPFLQPELNEAFFCGRLVLVEGAEDRAILTAALEHQGRYTDFIRCGGHIVCVNGKPSLISMVALARGFKTPLFVVFDGDTGCKADDVEGNKKINGRILSVMGMPQDQAWPADDVFVEGLIIWAKDIQSSLSTDHAKWFDEVRDASEQFGWKYERLKKNPSVLSYTIAKVLKDGVALPRLQKAADAIMAFATLEA